MKRADYQAPGSAFVSDSADSILGSLTANSSFAVETTQRDAWLAIIDSLKVALAKLRHSYVFLEFTIPRMGRRVDAIILIGDCVFVLEFKIGCRQFNRTDVDQVIGYALDLKNFHESSHGLPLFPVLIATGAKSKAPSFCMSEDRVCEVTLSDGTDLADLLVRASGEFAGSAIDPTAWVEGRYRPTPTIVEAAQALYRNHRVAEITRNEAGAENLSLTADYVAAVIAQSKQSGTKAICFITGVPGSGKTLAGLSLANLRTSNSEGEYAVFLSGNGPLVKVLRAALTNDQKAQVQVGGDGSASLMAASRSVDQFVQNIHHFRDSNVTSDLAPIEKVVIFDEAQRAWNSHKASQFMRDKRGQVNFNASEPQFLLSVMNRHKDWCTVVCLVGNGQEINTGEAGIGEWLRALATHFPDWKVHLSERILEEPEAFGVDAPPQSAITNTKLHLSTAIRSFRSESVSSFASAMIDGRAGEAMLLATKLAEFEFRITRDLNLARAWLRSHRRGTERAGILAFSNAIRLKPEGVFVKATIDPVDWFLADRADVRSSDYLEDIATEFDVQGLELDWACVCIDANLRITKEQTIEPALFRGTRWQAVKDPDRRKYIMNAHRVLLTRARQGVVIFLPRGDSNDPTRDPSWYEDLDRYFVRCGLTHL